MTTKKQIKHLLAPILERHTDIAAIESRMGLQCFITPLTHVNRGFMIWRTSMPDAPNYHWYLGYTFSPRAMPYGPHIEDFPIREAKTMRWSHPDHLRAFSETLESEVLPQLRQIDSLDKLVAVGRERASMLNWWWDHPIHRIRLQVAAGQFEAAGVTAREILAENRRESRYWNERLYSEIIEQLWPRVEQSDYPAIAALLHDWERQYVELNALGSIYEKTTFPFEVGNAP